MRDARTARRANKPGGFSLCLLISSLSISGLAWGQYRPPEPNFNSYNDFGGVGLLQIPSARMATDGDLGVSTGLVQPYLRTNISMQFLPWLETTLRYTDVRNRLYSNDPTFSGNQSYKDRGIDLKLRLLEESAKVPQLSLGFRDIGGTGLFSGEYIVLSKRYYDLDFTLGMGWGNLGTRGHFRNPLTYLSDRFKSRNVASSPGQLNGNKFFSGEEVALFGGVIYQTPIEGLAIKLEYDGNDYQHEALSNPQPVRSPINVGATYTYDNWLDFSLAYERGNRVMAQVAIRNNLHTTKGLPKLDPAPEAIKPRELSSDVADYLQKQQAEKIKDPVLRMSESLEGLDYKIESVEYRGKEMIATLSQSTFRNKAKAYGRAARVMANTAPKDIELLTIVDIQEGLSTQQVSIMRGDLEKAVRQEGSPEEMFRNITISPDLEIADRHEIYKNESLYPDFTYGWNPAMRHHIGGPDNPYFYQIFLRGFSEIRLNRNLSISGELGVNITNNFDSLKLASDSKLPHVRSEIKNYLKQGANGISNLQLDYITNAGRDIYTRFSAGLYEDMFGGVGGEILYKPFGERWAIGADLYRVRQRGYDKRIDFLDYEVTTGHLDIYYKLPFYDLMAQVTFGQYLAGDRGSTFTLSRRYESGAEIGVFATITNISAAQFGEGSFDKGAYISVPFDLVSFYSKRSTLSLGWRPLTRDGGQRLIQNKRLYPIVSETGRDALQENWSHVLE